MTTSCTATLSAITKGDAVCIVGFDPVTFPDEPILVARASRANLATSKTVFGIAKAAAAQGDSIEVLTAGDFADEDITGLGPGGVGTSRVIATDINRAAAADQCRLIRVHRPDGSEFVVGTCDEHGNLAVQPRASRDASALHVFNVKSYGAVADCEDKNVATGTDQSAAFQACLDAISTTLTSGARATTMYIPPAPHPYSYLLDENLSIQIPGLKILGASSGITPQGGSQLTFGRGKGIVVESFSTAPQGGNGEYCQIENLTINCTPPDGVHPWSAERGDIEVGTLVRPTKFNGIYLECIAIHDNAASGTPGATEPAWYAAASYPDRSVNWTPGMTVRNGTVVRATVQDGPDWLPDTAHLDVLFLCTTPIGAGPDETAVTQSGAAPTWDYALGHTTVEGNPNTSVVWTAVPSAGKLIRDGEAWWATRVHSGIVAFSPPRVVSSCVVGALNAGVSLFGDLHEAPKSSVSGWYLDRLLLTGNGMGVYTRGNDANAGSAYSLNVKGILGDDANVGCLDGSFLGSSWFGCFCEAIDGYAFWAAGTATSAVFYGCYGEGGNNPVKFRLEGTSQSFGANITEPFVRPAGANTTAEYFEDLPGYGSNAPSITTNGSKALHQVTPAEGGNPQITTYMTGGSLQAFNFVSSDDGPTMGWQYQPSGDLRGWWAHVWANSPEYTSHCVGNSQTGDLPGIFWLPIGCYRGSQAAPWYDFPDQTANESRVRGHLRKVGDVVWRTAGAAPGAAIADVVVAEGYEGREWRGNTLYFDAIAPGEPYARPASVVAPRNPENTNRFVCIKAGTSSGTEPDWSATPPITDGTAVWDLVGTAPTYAPFGTIGLVERVAMRSTGANDTIVDGDFHVDCTSGGITITLPAAPEDGETYEIKDANGNAGGGAITVSGNGHDIDGTGSKTIAADYGVLHVRYSKSLSKWVAV